LRKIPNLNIQISGPEGSGKTHSRARYEKERGKRTSKTRREVGEFLRREKE